MTYHFGTAEEADIAQLCELLRVLFEQEEEFRPDAAIQASGLRQIIENPSLGHIFVMRQGESIVAMVSLLYSISTALGERVAWLEDMVVSPECRGQNLGSQLLTYAIEQARDHGIARITLLTDQSNRSAQRFYQRAGFSSSNMLPMRLSLQEQ